MFVNDYGQEAPSKADNAADVITMTDVGGIGTLVYHTFRFKDYEYDDMPDGRLSLSPIVYKGMEPDTDKYNSLDGSRLFAELYNLGERVNSFEEAKSFDELMREFCLQVAHPYYIDSVYEILSEEKLSIEREGNLITEEAMFPVEEFKRDLEKFYHGARCYFALRQISDGEDCDYLSLWEDGREFAGIQLFNKYRYPVMPVQDSDEDEEDNFLPANATREEFYAFWQKEFAKAAKEQEAYEQFLEDHKDELYKYILQPIDDFYELRGKLMDMIPGFHMRLKVDPKSDKVVFAADVHSIFDIAWYTLARYMVDVQLTDEGTTETQYSDGKVCVCKCCGKAFVRTADQNRRQYCGDPECERKRARERTKRKREKDKIEASKKAAKNKKKKNVKSVSSADTIGRERKSL